MYDVEKEYKAFAANNSDKVEIVHPVYMQHNKCWNGAIFRILATGEKRYVSQSYQLRELLA